MRAYTYLDACDVVSSALQLMLTENSHFLLLLLVIVAVALYRIYTAKHSRGKTFMVSTVLHPTANVLLTSHRHSLLKEAATVNISHFPFQLRKFSLSKVLLYTVADQNAFNM